MNLLTVKLRINLTAVMQGLYTVKLPLSQLQNLCITGNASHLCQENSLNDAKTRRPGFGHITVTHAI